ncbi:MAG TPA: 50S ribosomal protein L21 [Thermoanaerobaculia bacterium]|nr:50S ribosomal protein L21 [Thermoanaerobaculia bacterium]
MYAILRAGGKQVKVSAGDVVRVEKPSGRKLSRGEEMTLSDVVLVSGDGSVRSAKDDLAKVAIKATVIGEVRNRKILVFKKKIRKQYRRTKGHRQTMVEVRIDSIEG